MSVTLLHRDDRGEVSAEGNEVKIIDRTSGDPVAIRMVSANETIGKLSICDAQNREVGFIGFKRDERGRTNPAYANILEIEVWSRKIGTSGWEDADYERIWSVRTAAQPPLPRYIALRSLANDKLVCAEGAGTQPLIANRDSAGPWETFEVIQVG